MRGRGGENPWGSRGFERAFPTREFSRNFIRGVSRNGDGKYLKHWDTSYLEFGVLRNSYLEFTIFSTDIN